MRNESPRNNQRRAVLGLIGAGVMAAAMPARASWLDRPIKIIVTFPPGGASDIVARVMAEQFSKKLNCAFIVENRPGAGGSIGGLAASQAAPDGNTLMLSNSTPISIGPFALEKQPYDPVTGFTHIAMIGTAPCVVMANPASGLKSLADIKSQVAAKGSMDFASGGPASIGHIYGDMMKKVLGLNLNHVPYRGGAPMTTDLLAGVIPMGIDVVTAYVPYFKNGKLVPLFITSTNRSPLVPDVPTIVELGHKDLVLDNFFGLSGPPGLPADIVSKLNATCNEILAQPDIKSKMLELGITSEPGTSADFTAYVTKQVNTLEPIVKAIGVRL